MGRKEIYTKEQIHAMKMNPYTHSVNAYQITFSLEFKEFFVDQIRNHRKNAPQILKAAGYDPSWFTKGCKSSLRRRILEEADSERGLRAPRGLSTAEQIAAFESKNLSADYADFLLIQKAYNFRGYTKGSRGVCMRLRRMGIKMNRKKVQRLMRKFHLFCPVRRANPHRRMAKALQTNTIAPNYVNRQFRTHGPRKVLLTDITYLRLHQKHVYLSVIKDAYTKQILAYQLSESLEVDFVLDTINSLMEKHSYEMDATVWIHSDQGCHYTSVAFRQLLEDYDLRQSMSRRGNCWDNAPQESFFGHMKDEIRPYIREWKSFQDVKDRIDDYINYYNTDRYQTGLEGMAPDEYYYYTVTGKKPLALVA